MIYLHTVVGLLARRCKSVCAFFCASYARYPLRFTCLHPLYSHAYSLTDSPPRSTLADVRVDP
jgi:hypothetical protein